MTGESQASYFLFCVYHKDMSFIWCLKKNAKVYFPKCQTILLRKMTLSALGGCTLKASTTRCWKTSAGLKWRICYCWLIQFYLTWCHSTNTLLITLDLCQKRSRELYSYPEQLHVWKQKKYENYIKKVANSWEAERLRGWWDGGAEVDSRSGIPFDSSGELEEETLAHAALYLKKTLLCDCLLTRESGERKQHRKRVSKTHQFIKYIYILFILPSYHFLTLIFIDVKRKSCALLPLFSASPSHSSSRSALSLLLCLLCKQLFNLMQSTLRKICISSSCRAF